MPDLNDLVKNYNTLPDDILRQSVRALPDKEFILFIRFVEPDIICRLKELDIFHRFGELFKDKSFAEFFAEIAVEHHNGKSQD